MSDKEKISDRTQMLLRDMFDDKLTDDQDKCISTLQDFLADDSQRVFLLKGYAGTGKTFLAGGLTRFLLTQEQTFSLAAPTGRATKVIAKKTGQSARTIHSLIYNYDDMIVEGENDDDESASLKMIAKVKNNETPINAVTIIDESSLISNVYSEGEFLRFGSGYLLQDLIAHVGSTHSGNTRKIIFVGDPAQLPPVNMSTSPALDVEYLRENFGLDVAGYELTEIVRQKADSAVIRNVIPLRESIARNKFNSLSFKFDDDVIHLPNDSVIPQYMKIRERHGSEAPIIVTNSNAEAATFNRAIRRVLFPGMKTVAAADRVIVAKNGFCESHYVSNGEILRIDSVEETVERRSVQLKQKIGDSDISKLVDVTLNFRDVTVVLPQLNGKDVVLTAKILDDFLHDDAASLNSAQQRALFVDFIMRHKHIDRKKQPEEFLLALHTDPYFNALQLRFGYAITCHKAQGGEWSHVVANCTPWQNPRSPDYFRWMYTAMTRTSGKLYLVNPPKFQLETQISFNNWLKKEVHDRLSDTKIKVENIDHYKYREAYFLKQNDDVVRIDFLYKKDWEISKVEKKSYDEFSNEVEKHLIDLEGQKFGNENINVSVKCITDSPFFNYFSDWLKNEINDKIADMKIEIENIQHYPYREAYLFKQNDNIYRIDLIYNKNWEISKIQVSDSDKFANEIKGNLAGLIGKKPEDKNKDLDDPSPELF